MNTDDPKFTAHLLGELDELTTAERAEIEALIRADAQVAAEAAETQALAALLRRELQGEETQPLTPAQRATVLAATACGARLEKAKVVPFPRRFNVLSAIAACLIVGVSIAFIFQAFDAEKATLDATAANKAPSGMTIALDPQPASPADLAKSPVVVPVVGEAGLKVADTLPPTDVKGLVAQRPPPTPQMPPPKTGNGQSPPPPEQTLTATPTVADGERKFLAGTRPDPELAGNAAVTGAYPRPKLAAPPPANGPAGKGGKTPPTARDQLASFDANRSDALRDYRPRYEGGPEKSGALLSPAVRASAKASEAIPDNAFLTVREHPLSTFGIDVETASYALVRDFLNEGQLPPKSAVRIEELVNHFTYDYPQPKGDAPFSATMEVASCPWTPAHRLVRIGLKGREIANDKLAAIAKNVSIEVEFNPAQVSDYRLIGYEKRLLAKEDSRHDKKSAREIVSGRTVTALYEIVPRGKDAPKTAALKYQTPAAQKTATFNELLTLKLRYQAPAGETSKLLEFPLTDTGAKWEKSSRDFRFAAAVAGGGLLLRDSPQRGTATWSSIHKLAVESKGRDATGERAEFIALLEKAQALQR